MSGLRKWKGKTCENNVTYNVEDDVDKIPDSSFSKSAAGVVDKLDNGKAGVLPSSKCVDLIETLGEGFHSEELAVNLQKVDPNESGSLERFAFVRWYLDKEVYLESAEEE